MDCAYGFHVPSASLLPLGNLNSASPPHRFWLTETGQKVIYLFDGCLLINERLHSALIDAASQPLSKAASHKGPHSNQEGRVGVHGQWKEASDQKGDIAASSLRRAGKKGCWPLLPLKLTSLWPEGPPENSFRWRGDYITKRLWLQLCISRPANHATLSEFSFSFLTSPQQGKDADSQQAI